MEATLKRVIPCFEYASYFYLLHLLIECSRAAALATGCEITLTLNKYPTYDLRQNKALGTFVSCLSYGRN